MRTPPAGSLSRVARVDDHRLSWTRQSVRKYDGHVVPGEDPMGRRHYWFTVSPLDEPEEGSDRWAMGQGLVSITPLRLDLTDEQALARAVNKQPLA